MQVKILLLIALTNALAANAYLLSVGKNGILGSPILPTQSYNRGRSTSTRLGFANNRFSGVIGSASVSRHDKVCHQPSLKAQSLRSSTALSSGSDSVLSLSPAIAAVPAAAAATSSTNSAYLAGMFTLWYAFNAAYNVFNAHMKKDFPFPLWSASLHLFVGLFYIFPLWMFGVRKAPNLDGSDILKLIPIAVLNALGHASAVVAMFQHGGGSFTHVIKASEPVVSVLLGFLVSGIVPKPLTALALLPITYGVAYASTLGKLNWSNMGKEFGSKAAMMAMVSNIAFALRSIFRKDLSHDFKKRTNLTPSNEHAVTTLLSLLLTLPFAMALETPSKAISVLQSNPHIASFYKNVILCGLSFYLYNDLQNMVLGSLGPVPTAVGNTLKRVVIFAALYFFIPGEIFPLPKVIGCAIAVLGCLGFAIFDSKKM